MAASLAEALERAQSKCIVCENAQVAHAVRGWVAALAGKRIGFQLERLSPAIKKDFNVQFSPTTLARHIRRCEPDLAKAASYR